MAPLVITIDLEDFHQLMHRRVAGELGALGGRLEAQMDRVLELLDKRATRATFFVLGEVAKTQASLVSRVANAGHEIGCHGHAHLRVRTMGRDRFREDLEAAVGAIGEATGRAPVGYRAAEFSIDEASLPWFAEELVTHGFRYDSSVFPFRGRRYGIPGAHLGPHVIETPAGPLWELPLATLDIKGFRVPVAGGGYWRLLPLWALKPAFGHLNAGDGTRICYMHPYELDPEALDVGPAFDPVRRWFHSFRFNLGRQRIYEKLDGILSTFPTTTAAEYLESHVNQRS